MFPLSLKLLPILFLATGSLLFAKQTPPNIVIFLTDDLGYGSVGYQGGMPKTPHIDALAETGIRFTDFYSGMANCSPSRAALLTGRNPARVGMYNWRPDGSVMHLQDAELTIAEALKEQGYQTGVFGKWHLSDVHNGSEQPLAQDQGFDVAFVTANNARPNHLNPDNFYLDGEPLGVLEGYSCQIVVDKAIETLDGYTTDAPFFHYIAFHEPHTIIASPPEMIAQYPGATPKAAAYYANVQNIDDAMGRYLEMLDAMGVRENTLVFFLSDNGGVGEGSSNGPLRDFKGRLYDGGIKTPAVMSWPARYKKPRLIEEPLSFVDIFPTLHSFLGTDLPESIVYDGVSFVDVLKGKPLEREQHLFWYFYNPQTTPPNREHLRVATIRKGDFVLVALDEDSQRTEHNFEPKHMETIHSRQLELFELYNVREDPGQTKDVSTQYPRLVKGLSSKLKEQLAGALEEGPDWRTQKP